MKFKLVPEPPTSLDVVADAQRAVPLVPDTEDDCCARLMNRLDFPSRDVARTWLTFLRALGLAEETPSGFRRTDAGPTHEAVREAFLDGVFGASAVRSAVTTAGPLDVDETFERIRDRVPTWERHKNPTEWEDVWRERTGRILDWLVLLEAVERTDDGRYRSA